MVALKSSSSRRPIPTPPHQPILHYVSEGLIRLKDRRKDVEQLELPVQRVEVDQRDVEDDRRSRPPTILREQQRSTYTTCVEVGGCTLFQLRKPGVGSAAAVNHPKTARRATQDGPPRRRWRRRSSCGHLAKPPFNPLPTARRRRRSQATLPIGLVAISEGICATLQGQGWQRCGASSSAPPLYRAD